MNSFYTFIAARALFLCEYCHALEQASPTAFEVEHIVPKREGGSDDVMNLALSCRSCNQYKGVATTGLDTNTDFDEPFFNPRTDVWREHFRYDLATLTLQGKTATGRATVLRLQMNSERQIAARRVWRAAGLPF